MAGNPFDSLKQTAFNVVTDTMGYDVSWSPIGGGAAKTGRALYDKPTKQEEGYRYRDHYGKIHYEPNQYRLEYRAGVLDGLKESADSGNLETIEIIFSDTVTESFRVMEVHQLWDGDTYVAVIDKL